MKNIFFCIIICFSVTDVFSQTSIYGIIKNADTDESLAYANIYIEGTYIGTTSNQDGQYSLEVPALPSLVIVSYIGYEIRKIRIEIPGTNKLDILLKPIILKLKKVVITGNREDPAIGIMKKVISNKIKWQEKLKSYRAKAYTRSKVENHNSIVSISESISRLYWDSRMGSHEEFMAKKSSKRMSYLTELNVGSKNTYNFYHDNIQLINHAFVGPTHPEALKYYDFKLKRERNLNNKTVFDIKVTPKSKLQPLFSGRISVLDEDFAMIEIDLKNSGNMSFFTMLKYFQGNYQQQFNNFGKEFWLPIDSRVKEIFEVDMGLIAFPQAIFNKISRISDYEINIDVTNEIAELDTTSTISPSSSKIYKNDSAFKEFKKVPLTAREYTAYTNPDTTMTLIKSFPPTGILAPYFKSKEKELETGLSEHSGYSPLKSSTDVGFQGWFNRVEGLNLGIKYNYQFHDRYLVTAIGGYQTFSKKFYYQTHLNYIIHKDDENKFIFAGYYDKTDTRYDSERYSQIVTSVLPLLGKYDYFDYYLNKKFTVGIKYGITNIKSEISFEFNNENHSSISRKTNWNILGRNDMQRKNPLVDDGRLNSLKLNFFYEQTYNLPKMEKMFGNETNKIELQIEHSSPQYLNSDFHFTRFKFFGDYRLTTFFPRRPDYNYLRIRVEAATHTGSLPLQRFSIIDGSILSYSSFGIFKTLINKPLEGEKKLGIFWEHNFTSIPFEILGLKYFSKNKYEFIVHGASGRTWINADRLNNIKQNYSPHYKNELHHELGISLVIKYKFLSVRLDGTRNLSNNNNYIGFSLNLIAMSF